MTDNNGGTAPSDYVARLREMMTTWNWSEDDIARALPRFVQILVDVGILRARSDGAYETTELVEDDDAWAEAWERAEKEGVAGSEPAS